MGVHVIKLPDVGEGVAEAELVEWLVEDGEDVREDQPLASVMTDKATVEIPSPVDGKVVWRGAALGEVVAVGSALVRLEVAGAANGAEIAAPDPGHAPAEQKAASAPSPSSVPSAGGANGAGAPLNKPLTSPAVRRRAREAGVDLADVPGSGPLGRITNEDLIAFLERGGDAPASRKAPSAPARDMTVTDIPVIGLRRRIADQMHRAASRIAHITYVEEIDVTALEELRTTLNAQGGGEKPKLTILPFLMRAMARAIAESPRMNAHFDDEAGVIRQHGAMHMGVAAQTSDGLVVPVVSHVEARGLWDCAAEVARLAEAARQGRCTREELSGSTITITSLGALGGVVTTPIVNHPEVAIVGVNRIRTLPHWDGGQFVPRRMMNLSSSFDHRVIDGHDAAVFIQRIKSLLETPAMIFIED